jgi:NAD(P)-dependent dehydrogenase (short-subunit alcohol dehydrogenase family)
MTCYHHDLDGSIHHHVDSIINPTSHQRLHIPRAQDHHETHVRRTVKPNTSSSDQKNPQPKMAPQIFFITGTSTGFGYHYVEKCLKEGDKVIATARNSSKLSFPSATPENLLTLDCDVTKQASIDAAFEKSLSHFGRIDVVVNNAGYGLSGEFESLSESQIRTQMEVNFFGLLNVTRKALEIMREKNSPPGGRIQQITSIGGQRGVPTFSVYCASKWAVEGFTESLQQELKPEWNIKLTCIEPGGFRTDWAGRSMDFGAEKNPAYDHIDAKTQMGTRNGTGRWRRWTTRR